MEKKKTRRKFSREYKLEALRMSESRGTAEVARSLGIGQELLYQWRKVFAADTTEAFRGNGNRTELEEENRLLKKRIKDLEEDQEILKKASAYFAKNIR